MLDSEISKIIRGKIKDTPEQKNVVAPIVERLCELGWSEEQIIYGRREWRIPKNPSQATCREKSESFEGWPCDIAVFDSPKHVGDYRHILFLVECKQPNEDAGLNQLEIYLSQEPYAKAGIWANNPDPASDAIFVYRINHALRQKRRKINDLPSHGDTISPKSVQVAYDDLVDVRGKNLTKTFEQLLDGVVAQDSIVTRREDQLNQLCNLILLKLDSDKRAKAKKDEQVVFRPGSSVVQTADAVRREFVKFANLIPAIFTTAEDHNLRLSDNTIANVVEKLYRFRLIDAGPEAVSTAFQVLRSAALKQGEGQYFTPQPVIQAAVKLMRVEWDDIVIDPACGTGGFLIEVLLDLQRRFSDSEIEVSRWAQVHLHGIDKDAIGIKLTKAIMQILGDGSAHCVRGDSLARHLWRQDFPHLNTTEFKDGRFTMVLTNPPFGSGLKISGRQCREAGLSIASAGGGVYRDLELGLLFLQRCHQLLRKGGKLCIVLPETYFFSSQYEFVQDWVSRNFVPQVVVNIPMEAFQGFCRAKTNLYVFEKI